VSKGRRSFRRNICVSGEGDLRSKASETPLIFKSIQDVIRLPES